MAVTEPPAVPFGGLLRRLRIDAGLTQEELAEAARLSYRSISDLERGISLAPRKETIRLLADALNLAGAERTEFEAAARWRGRVGGFMAQAVPAGSVAAAQPLPAGGTQVNYWGKDSLGPEAGLSIARRWAELTKQCRCVAERLCLMSSHRRGVLSKRPGFMCSMVLVGAERPVSRWRSHAWRLPMGLRCGGCRRPVRAGCSRGCMHWPVDLG